MSNYGPKTFKLYSQVDNFKRKANNLTDQLPLGANSNVKCISTKPGQLSSSEQAQLETLKYKKLNKKQPVKTLKDFTPEELKQLSLRYRKVG